MCYPTEMRDAPINTLIFTQPVKSSSLVPTQSFIYPRGIVYHTLSSPNKVQSSFVMNLSYGYHISYIHSHYRIRHMVVRDWSLITGRGGGYKTGGGGAREDLRL